MKNGIKRFFAVLMVMVMLIGIAPLSGFVGLNLFSISASAEEEGLITETNNTITRAQWLHNLAVLFDMSVEDNNYPDNYYTDLPESHTYYKDIMFNIEFGVIDIEAGGEIQPDERLTREFAAQTLNSCLGFQLEDETYSFTDVEDCMYLKDVQVAVNRGWFALENGKFMPSALVNDNEVSAMVEDTQAVLNKIQIDENYDSTFDFNSNVVEVPDGTDVSIEGDTVTIIDCPVTIAVNQTFVIYVSGLPVAYRALSVQKEGNETVITGESVDSDTILQSADAQGTFALADNFEIIEGESGEVNVITEEESSPAKAPGMKKVSGTKKLKSKISVKNKFSIGEEASVNYNVVLNNPTVSYYSSTLTRTAYAKIDADATITFSGEFDFLKSIKDEKLTLFTLSIFGVGNFDIKLDLSLKASISGNYSCHLTQGVSYSPSDGFRVERSFKSKSFSISAAATGSVGLKAMLGITQLPCLKAYVWASIGGKASLTVTQYLDNNTPKECVSFYAYVYCSIGATASVKFLAYSRSYDLEKEIWNATSSPAKIAHHYEDGKEVASCTRSGSGSGSHLTRPYYSKWNSVYGGSGWNGSTSSSKGLDGSGNEVPIFTYTVDDDDNATITKYQGYARSVIIPEKLDGHTVVGIGYNAFLNNKTINYVKLNSSILKLTAYAFKNCSSLESVFIPKSLNSGGDDYTPRGAFDGCSNLNNVTIEDGINKIPEFLFCGCTGIKTINIPDSVTKIENYAFYRCTNLNSIEIPDSVTMIGYQSFGDCSELGDVKLSKNLTKLTAFSFRNCTSLESIFIPKSLSSGGDDYTPRGAFDGCSNLNNVTIEDGINKIPEFLFCGCTGIKTINIPSSVTKIENYAFYRCTNLNSIEIPDSVTVIGYQSFGDCTELSNVKLSKNLTKLTAFSFRNCTSLESICIPKSLNSGGDDYTPRGAFDSCSNLTNVTIEDGITKIPEFLFCGCNGIETIKIPDSVKIIEAYSFRDCINLKDISLSNQLVAIKGEAFRNCTSLCNIAFPDKLESISDGVFLECTSLKRVSLPESVTSIGNGIFQYCASLKEVNLPEGQKNISDYMFRGCESLEEITLPDTITKIQHHAFLDCTSLKTVNWSNNLVTIEGSTFENCYSLTDIHFPSTVTIIDQYAFHNCDGIESVIIPNSVTTIGNSVFNDADSLKNVTLSNNITSIPESAFEHNDVLESIIIPYRVTSIGNYAFRNDVSLTSVFIPQSVTSIGSEAFSYPDKMTIYGVAGSYAETYANENGYTFVGKNTPATGITLSQTELTINNGQTANLYIDIAPLDFTDTVSWKSTNTSVATIDASGKLTAKSAGTATIKVLAGSVSATCRVTVVQPVTSIALNKTSISLNALETYQLTATVKPTNAFNRNVEWTVDNSSIATVNENGLVTGLKKGTAIVTVSALDGSGITKQCTVTVKNSSFTVNGTDGFESSHNYENNCSDIWRYQSPGAETIKITFDERTNIEEDFDFLYIYDGNNNQIGSYTGTALAGAAVEIPGDTVKIKLVSDESGTEWGFKVNHIYINGQERTDSLFINHRINIYSGDTLNLSDLVNSESTSGKDVSWSASDSPAAIISNEKIIAVTPGYTEITVSVTNADNTVSYDVAVIHVIGVSPKASTVIDNDTNFISGLAPKLIDLDDYVSLYNSLGMTYSTNVIGTGTTVNIMNGDDCVDTYTTVIFGDVNGDGWYDGQDATIVNCIANGMLTREQVGEAKYLAADCNHDGEVNASDVLLLEQAGLLLANVDQTASQDELMQSDFYMEYLNLIDQNPAGEEPIPEEPAEPDPAPQTILVKLIEILQKVITFIRSLFPKI